MTRHSWGEPNRMAKKSERECKHGCGIIKVTLHPYGREGSRHTIEFYRDGGSPSAGRRALAFDLLSKAAKAAVAYDARSYPL